MQINKFKYFLLFNLIIGLTLILSLNLNNFSKSPNGNWSLQNFSGLLNGRAISDMTFLDSLTGYGIASSSSSTDTAFIFKTTNGGDNWFTSSYYLGAFGVSINKIKFVTDSIGFCCGGDGAAFIRKTTDRGNTWIKYSVSAILNFVAMSCINKDTIYAVDPNSFNGGVFRSVNGGQNWAQLYFAAQYNPTSIYMINSNIGFITDGGGNLRKTTNGGYNWTSIPNAPGFGDIHFFDTLTGYIAAGYIYKTTNGGNNWTVQVLPVVPGGFCSPNAIGKFAFLNKDTIFAVGSYIQYPPSPYRDRGIINKTTNGGINWGYQIPDTHYVSVPGYSFIMFVNKKCGWAYLGNGMGIHTITGGYDTTLYTDIKKEIEILISKDYKLYQNYPNPFNTKTKIKYKITERSFVEISVYDIRGRSIAKLEEKLLNAGEYETNYNAENLSSGIYFYTLKINGVNVFTRKMMLIK